VSKVGTYQVIKHGDEVHGGEDGHVMMMMMIKLQLGKKEREK
jgi:hypothetical protein